MIVLGICPGVRSLAYCVLCRRELAAPPVFVDSDLLKGGRPKPGDKPDILRRKIVPHTLTLAVVLERAFDLDRRLVMAIGPGAKDEPAELVYLVRAALVGLCATVRENGCPVEYVSWETQAELEALGSSKKQVRSTLKALAPAICHGPYLVAAGSALAALEHFRPEVAQA